jgi:hypothetical protein
MHQKKLLQKMSDSEEEPEIISKSESSKLYQLYLDSLVTVVSDNVKKSRKSKTTLDNTLPQTTTTTTKLPLQPKEKKNHLNEKQIQNILVKTNTLHRTFDSTLLQFRMEKVQKKSRRNALFNFNNYRATVLKPLK